MSDVTLSNAVRANLLSLQNTASLLGKTQERLATGKRVNSALDNPINFFTASALESRSGDLSSLLDSVSNGVQTLRAADAGIKSIQKLVDSAKATARQALQAPVAFTSKPSVTSDVDFVGDASTVASSTALNGVASKVTGTVGGLTLASTFTPGAITITEGGGNAVDFTGVTTVGGAIAAINATDGLSARLTDTGNLEITASEGTGVIIGGAANAETGLVQSTPNALDGQAITLTTGEGPTLRSVTVTIGNDKDAGEVNTIEDLNRQIANAGVAVEGVVTTDGQLRFQSTNAAAGQTFELLATDATEFGGAAAGDTINSTPPTFGGPGDAQRREAVREYNDLLKQINVLAQDASFNGINLLNGDDLSVIFNENGSSKLDIKGVVFDSEGLGLSDVEEADFLDTSSINAVLDTLDSTTATLRSQASKFGSSLGIVQTREDFTKELVNVLQTGAANLTLADSNQEGANLLALQTRQQLSTTALSLSSQSEQAVLRLF